MASVETEPRQQEHHTKTRNDSTIMLTEEHVSDLLAQRSGFSHYMLGHFLTAESPPYFDEKCAFCNIIRDETNAVTKIWHGPWDKDVIVFRPINPASEDHWLPNEVSKDMEIDSTSSQNPQNVGNTT